MSTRAPRASSSSAAASRPRTRRLGVALPVCLGAFAVAAGVVAGCGSESGADGSSSGASGASGFLPSDPDASLSGQACATSTKRAERVPVDIGLALDTSFSMDFDSKWINTKAALKAFVNNPAYQELGLALQFFPERKQCSVTAYAQPAVEVGLLPTIAAEASSALDAQKMEGGTPIVQVLTGMTQYMRAHAATSPSRKPIILLATDGVPDASCAGTADGNIPNTLENAVKQATDALNGTPSIPTFVIGVGTDLAALDQIAAAGGTDKAILIDPTKNVQESFLGALDTIRRNAIPCDYDIPESGSGPVDPTKVNVTYSASSSPENPETFGFVGGDDQCSLAPETGWYFDDPAAPKKVVLCPNTCERVKADDLGQVNVVFGCARRDVR